MQILIEVDNDEMTARDALAAAEKISRDDLLRQAIGPLLVQKNADKPETAFGLWTKHTIDGLEYEDALRSEW